MHPLIEEIYRTRIIHDAAGQPRDAFPASLRYEDGQALYRVVKESGAKNSLEVGMAYGVSSLFILQALKENGGTYHASIDPWQEKWWQDIGLLNVQRGGFGDMHQLHRGPSYSVMPDLMKEERRFDFIFIDGNHRFEYTLMDFMYADMLLNTGGYIMLHDPWLPSIRKVISFLITNRSEAYEFVTNYLHPPRNPVAGMKEFLTSVRKNPWDLRVAKFFARKSFDNYCVFRKTKHVEREAYDAAWDQYSPF